MNSHVLKIQKQFIIDCRGGICSLILLFSFGCGTQSGQPARHAGKTKDSEYNTAFASHPIRTGFVGSEACQKCHPNAYASFHHHPMSESLDTVTNASKIENFDQAEFSTLSGLSYYVESKDGSVFHHEKRVDAAGELIYDQAVKVAFSVGAGSRGRSYLINESGRLYASPVSWFRLNNKWALSPGYAPESNPRFDRRVSDGCVSCHAGRTLTEGHDLNRFAPDPFIERSIGCERCHGPGKDHITFRSGTDIHGDDPIFNPARVTDARRDAVCNQCHLQGRRRVVLSGRTEFDFQPGLFLSENWIVFLKTASIQSNDAAAAVSQVEQMYSSRCYKESKGRIGCITCHAGHELPSEKNWSSFYRDKCVQCHSSPQRECSEPLDKRTAVVEDDSCVKCHMPRFPAADVHSIQTDHRVLRRPNIAVAETKKTERFRDAKLAVFEEPGVRIPKAERDRARGMFLAQQAAAGGTSTQAQEAIDLLTRTIQKFPRDVEGRFLLGQALEAVGQNELALQVWEEVLRIQPTHEDALEGMATINHQSGNLPAAKAYYERLILVSPERPNHYGRLAHVLGQLDEMPEAIAMAEKCLSMNPSLIQSHVWLVEAYRRIGNDEMADLHEAKVQQFQSHKNRSEQKAPSDSDKR